MRTKDAFISGVSQDYNDLYEILTTNRLAAEKEWSIDGNDYTQRVYYNHNLRTKVLEMLTTISEHDSHSKIFEIDLRNHDELQLWLELNTC